jgi:Family of unknown function (DUF6338)
MAPQTGTALLLLAVFVLPGFVTLLLRERMFAVRDEDTQFERLLNALYYSALIYAIVFAVGALIGLDKRDVVGFYRGEKSLAEDLEGAVAITLVIPAAIAVVGLRWRGSNKMRPFVLNFVGVSPSHGVSSAWNEAFSREGSPMLRVTLKDGRVVGGYFGDGSLAGYSEHAQDLLISERWSIDKNDWFMEVAPGTEGLWIAHDEIASIEFYERPPNTTDSKKEQSG